jgi:hypothetical protein
MGYTLHEPTLTFPNMSHAKQPSQGVKQTPGQSLAALNTAWNRPKNVPPGRPKIAQRFIAGTTAANSTQAPSGAKEASGNPRAFFRPSRDSFPCRPGNPAMNRWAIVFRPAGLPLSPCFQDLRLEPLELAGQPQLQRLAQFVEPHQHPAFVLEADDLLLEPLEEHLRGAAGNLVPVDAGDDGGTDRCKATALPAPVDVVS